MEQIRVGMVGAGFAADFHVEAFRQVKGVDCPVVAVTSARAESREAFARKHHIVGVYGSVEEMLEKAQVDVLDVCVPTNMHAPVSLLAAQAGKHVIVEKPFTGYTKELWNGAGGEWDGDVPLIGKFVDRRVMLDSVVAQCDEVEKALSDAGSKFCYAENWVYAPAVQKARRLIEAGKGTVLRLLAEESHSGSHASYAKYWALAGGGSLLRTG